MNSKPIKFTREQGGTWLPWKPNMSGVTVFATMFEDGMIFDPISGWRPSTSQEQSPRDDEIVVYQTLEAANDARSLEWDPEAKLDSNFALKEFIGEWGEFNNWLKKIERDRLGLRGNKKPIDMAMVKEELADTIITFDLYIRETARELGWSRNDVLRFVAEKFNSTSRRNDFKTRLAEPQT